MEIWNSSACSEKKQCVFLLFQARGGGGHILKKMFYMFHWYQTVKKYIFHDVQFNKIFLLLGKIIFFDKLIPFILLFSTSKICRHPEIYILLKTVKPEGGINEIIYRRLYPTGAGSPKFYGLPKVHKEGIPPRPLVSSIGSVTYETAKN